jgi:hypothetical protein
MGPWMNDLQLVSQLTGWEPLRQQVNSWANWYWDSTAWTFLNLWYMPHQIPGLYSDTDKWISQFSLNGIKATSICR